MNKFTKVLSFLLAVTMLFSMAACTGNGESTGSTSPSGSTGGTGGEKGTYTVTVQTEAGMVLEGCDINIYGDSALLDLKQVKTTDKNGVATFELAKDGTYFATVDGLPLGYNVADSYAFSGNTCNITLSTSLVQGESLPASGMGIGDIMYDFEVTTVEGEKLKLSEVLATKKLVVLNFWYTTCSGCVKEFPYMQNAYELYKDDVEIIALNPGYDDTNSIRDFAATMGLTFPMASCDTGWTSSFYPANADEIYYPTSVFIDRYGMICLVEIGGLIGLTKFTSIFDHFIADDYEQELASSGAEWIEKPKPFYDMDSSEDIGNLINSGDINVTYRPEEGDEYSWPFIITDRDGIPCVKASNQDTDPANPMMDGTYAIMYMDVELKAGQAVGFDYLISSEANMDVLHVIVNGEPIYTISGVKTEWKSAYPWVAMEDGVYEVALCYIKDESTLDGEDTVYIKNVRIAEIDEIDTPTYIPRYASTMTNDGYTYADVYFNEADGYYHVGSPNGPLLLAALMDYCELTGDETTIFEMADLEHLFVVDGHDYYEDLLPYFTLASNSSLGYYCTVDYQLGELLKLVASVVGFDGTENEWLKACKYFDVYGTNGAQLIDPIKGLRPASAFKAELGVGIDTNKWVYDGRPILPRGLLFEFIPEVSGVYCLTTHTSYTDGLDAWIFDENMNMLYQHAEDSPLNGDPNNLVIMYYMEAGKAYYFDVALWDMYGVAEVPFDLEFVSTELKYFRLASSGPFTSLDENMSVIISLGIPVVIDGDGYYREDLGLDASGNQIYGSYLYADFANPTWLSAGLKTVIEMGGFDFSYSDDDQYILSFLREFDFDVEATDAHLRELWGNMYESYAEEYKIAEVFEGIYHGAHGDCTERAEAYLDKILNTGDVTDGCVMVDEELAELLQWLMDKYTFEGVEYSWLKLCYYFDTLGAE